MKNKLICAVLTPLLLCCMLFEPAAALRACAETLYNCSECKGSGKTRIYGVCDVCDGKGEYRGAHPSGLGYGTHPCYKCGSYSTNGVFSFTGKAYNDSECFACSGTGKVSQNDSVTIKYHLCGGYAYENGKKVTTLSQVKLKRETIQLIKTIPIKSGNDFVGWTVHFPLSAKKGYLPGADFTKNNQIDLYAIWQPYCEDCGGTGQLETISRCPSCKGAYRKVGTFTCSVCHGSGKRTVEFTRCPMCSGSGTAYIDVYPVECPICKGKGTVTPYKKEITCDTCSGGGSYTGTVICEFCTNGNIYDTVRCDTCRGVGNFEFKRVYGDSNLDDSLTIADGVLLQKYLVGAEEFDLAQIIISDIDQNNTVDVYDMVYLRRLLIGDDSWKEENPYYYDKHDSYTGVYYRRDENWEFQGFTEESVTDDITEYTVLSTVKDKPVVSVADNAFSDIMSLTGVELPESLESIGQNAFYGCESLADVNIPDSVKIIDSYAFSKCLSLKSVNIPYGVKNIGNDAFSGCSGLTEVNIPDSVETIGKYAFSYCTNLTDVTVSKNIVSLEYTFLECDKLKNVVLPEGIEVLSGTFSRCYSLVSINIPESVREIGEMTFYRCHDLESVNIPDGVVSIGEHAFEECRRLMSIDIPDSVNEIGEYALRATALTSVRLPKNLKIIKEGTFDGCDQLFDVTISDGVTAIEDMAFEGCIRLESIELPEGLERIDRNAFDSCLSLKLIRLPENLRSMGKGIFNKCEQLVDITIPDGVTAIPDEAFYGCISLESVKLPEGLETIGNRAFVDCVELKSLTIPKNTSSIGKYAVGYKCYLDYQPYTDFIIYGEKGSAAETYAAENSITFIEIG